MYLISLKGISILKKGDKYPSVFYKLPLNLPARVKSDKRIKIRLPFKMNNTIKKITVEADKYADKPISWTTEVRLYSPAKKNLPRYSETLKTLKGGGGNPKSLFTSARTVKSFFTSGVHFSTKYPLLERTIIFLINILTNLISN